MQPSRYLNIYRKMHICESKLNSPFLIASYRFLCSNAFHLMLCIVGGFLCFLPLALRVSSNFEESIMRLSIADGNYFRDSSVASLALALPLALDIVIDLGISLIRRMRVIPTESTSIITSLNSFEKALCLIGIIIVPLTAFLPKSDGNFGLIFVCCNKCQSFIVGATVMTSFSRCNNDVFSNVTTVVFLFMFMFAQTSSTFALNASVGENPSDFNNNLLLAGNHLTMIAASIVLVCSIRCLIILISQARSESNRLKSAQPNETSRERHSKSHIFFRICWMAVFIVGTVLLIALSNKVGSIEKFNEKALVLNTGIYFTFELAITILTMRMVKFDVVKGLYALIDSKKSYVRYISHELRTPLNTAFLGLKLLTDEMKMSNDIRDVERYDTLRDVNLSCKAALDILNDLLCFDKLESGILELHKQDTNIVPFITDCIAMFAAQARENDIKVTFINTGHEEEGYPGGHTSYTSSLANDVDKEEKSAIEKRRISTPIGDSEKVFIDKFKMDQVVRNLISNALKFTPKSGSISIKVAFIPQPELTAPEMLKMAPLRRRSRTSIVMFSRSNSSSDIDVSNDDSESEPSWSFTEGTLVIEVADSGAGISFENQQRLFKDIVQFNPEILQAGGGSGLGLWITKGIVDLHNGTISVHSDGEECGCNFIVRIPMLRRIKIEPELEVPPPRLASLVTRDAIYLLEHGTSFSSLSNDLTSTIPIDTLSRSGSSFAPPIALEGKAAEPDLIPEATEGSICPEQEQEHELLVVDDSQLNRKMLCKILRGAGYKCDEAEDGRIALQKVSDKMGHSDPSRRSYDAILMDYVMPNMDGPTATSRIRGLKYTGQIFGVTGNALDTDVEYFMACGADRIFTKPLDIAEFQQHMELMHH